MKTNAGRMEWLDTSKGLAILWIVYFHLADDRSPIDPAHAETPEQLWHWLVSIGYQAVGMFLLISGWSLTQSCAKQERHGPIEWGTWYRKKFFRLFPLYWAAHLAFVVFLAVGHVAGVTLVEGYEPLDGRFWYSLFGLRFVDIHANFYYLNAAWWYFSALIQLYLVFPLLYIAGRRYGLVPVVVAACALGFGLRYFALYIAPSHESMWWFTDSMWMQGGLGLCRLPEFAVGMLVGDWHLRHRQPVERFLLKGPGLATALLAYPLVNTLGSHLAGNVFLDLATGVCFLLLAAGLAGLLAWVSPLQRLVALCGTYSYGIYLLHQPHVNAVSAHVRGLSPWLFAPCAIAIIVFVAAEGIWVERGVNGLMARWSDGTRRVGRVVGGGG